MIRALLWMGCAPLPPPPDPVDPGLVQSVEALWGGTRGAVVIEELVVASPRTLSGGAFYAQRPEGGPASGLRVVRQSGLDELPPAVGTPVRLTGVARSGPDGPELLLLTEDGVEEVGEPISVVAGPFTGEARLAQTLVRLEAITVVSDVDPAGQADTDGLADLGGQFGVTPGWRRHGDLVGIVAGGRVHARFASDFGDALPGDPPLDVGIDALATLDDGTPVALSDVVQATPWDRLSGRWIVLQDADGHGVWVDTEGWGLAPTSELGEQGHWTGEVRHDAEGVFLRAWEPPSPSGGIVQPLVVDDPVDGALVQITVRQGDGRRLDDRFLDLTILPDPARVHAVVRGDDPPVYAIVAILAP